MVSKMNGESLDITAQNIEYLKELFPEVVTDGEKIDFDMLKTVLGEVIENEQERYQFTWNGKKKMIAGAQKPSKGTLRPIQEKSKDFDTTKNLYIEGDNLEVLKLLQKSYNSKVKVIYIDPPYNTGKDFVYKDNFKNGVNSYLEQTGQIDTEGKMFSTNLESNGRFHTDWLNMIYPRIKLSRNLLMDDGVMYISIDENEQEKMKMICNEIFGEKNFISEVIWEKKFAPQNDAKYFSLNHEHIFVYAKNKSKFKRNLLPMTNEQISRYRNPDNDPRGLWQSDNLTVATYNVKYDYPIITPNGNIINPTNGRCWNTSQEKMNDLIKDNRIWFGENGGNTPRIKRFLSEIQQGIVPISIWKNTEVGNTQSASKDLKRLFENKKYFDYPKPVNLITKILKISTGKDDIILDFFSGSATTAHATMQLNAEDGGNRKFIMVQLPEVLDEKSEAYKDGYRTICDIGEERIRRAGDKIKKELQEKQKQAGILGENTVDPDSLDIGFKVLKLDTSNIREWNVDFANLENELALYETPFTDNRSELDIVYEIILKQGLELTYPIETFEVNNQTIYDIAFGSLFICLSNRITPEIAKAISVRRDEQGTETSSVIFSDSGFINDSDKLNCIEILKDTGYPEDNLLTI
ncbi:site-specific DNA-methyltransferase [Exiguobacterium sp. KRL4]|uniref:site-specific DNA-methyltransferase n=1 Tax=Exiguobacterium sp. KRL4 TaxID=1914536 RepID=UPI0008F8FDE7|nr:site-specific DNA-methyltransferase [Exiguobacterium sp. KRL4]OIN66539.1 site-specific DNA-methyltransferase [Exiguobacterium sp. KRL4]